MSAALWKQEAISLVRKYIGSSSVTVTPASAPPSPSTVSATPTKEKKTMWFAKLLGAVVGSFKGWFAKEIPTLTAEAKAELTVIEESLIAFAKSDLGKLALDAVNSVQGVLAGGVGGPAFLAAKTKFIADAKAAGHDLEKIGSGIVDWCIQTAYTIISGVVAQTTPTV